MTDESEQKKYTADGRSSLKITKTDEPGIESPEHLISASDEHQAAAASIQAAAELSAATYECLEAIFMRLIGSHLPRPLYRRLIEVAFELPLSFTFAPLSVIKADTNLWTYVDMKGECQWFDKEEQLRRISRGCYP